MKCIFKFYFDYACNEINATFSDSHFYVSMYIAYFKFNTRYTYIYISGHGSISYSSIYFVPHFTTRHFYINNDDMLIRVQCKNICTVCFVSILLH